MRRNRILGTSVWAIAFALSVFLTLIIPPHFSDSVAAVLVFDAIAYLSVLILWMYLFGHTKTPDDILYNSPALTVSAAYLAIQLVLCIAVGLLVDTISFKMTLLLNVVLMAAVWILILSTIIAKGHSQQVDSRQKDHHVEL